MPFGKLVSTHQSGPMQTLDELVLLEGFDSLFHAGAKSHPAHMLVHIAVAFSEGHTIGQHVKKKYMTR